MLPLAAFDRGFNGVSRCSSWQHDKSVAEVLMDVSTHECIHLMTTRGNGGDVILRQCWKDKPVGYVNAELVAAPASAGVALEARVNTLGRISTACLRCYPPSRHAHIDKAAIAMPDRVDPAPNVDTATLGQSANK